MATTIAEAVAEARKLDLRVDENCLLEEWQTQGALMLEWGIWLADAIDAEDEAKAALAVVTSELDRDIRADPSAFSLGRVTDSSVTNAIPGQPEHIEAMKALRTAKHHVRVLRAACDGIDNRRSSLKGMTEVFNRQWYADPTSPAHPPALREAAMDMTRPAAGRVKQEGPPTKTIEGRKPRRPKRK